MDLASVDWTLLLFLALAVVAILFMFRSSKKRREMEAEMRAKIQPGVEVMTQGGFFGTLISIDTDKNEAIIETTPGTRLRVHSQIIARAVEPEAPESADANDESAK